MSKYFDVAGAKKAGYSDDAIKSHMAKKNLSVKPTVSNALGFGENIVKSAGRFAKDIATPLLSPIETLKSTINLASGAQAKMIPGQQQSEKSVDAVGDFYKKRYGGADNIGRSLYFDPVGVGADVATLATGAGAALKGAGTAGKFSNVSKLGRGLESVGSAIDPVNVAMKGAGATGRGLGKISSPITSKLDDVISPDRYTTGGLGNPGKQAQMITPMEELVPKYDLWDRSPDTARARIGDVNELRAQKIVESGALGDLQDLLKPLDNEIASIKNNPNLFRGDIPLSQEASKRLNQLQQNRKNIVMSFAETGDNVTNLNPRINVSEVDSYRSQNIDPNIPQGAFAKQMSQTPAKDQAFKQTRNALKSAVDEAAGTKQLGADIQSLYKAEDVFKGYQNRAKNRQPVNIHKMGSLFAGGAVAGVPGAVGGFLTEQFINSPAGAKFMYEQTKKLKDIGSKAPSMPETGRFTQMGNKVSRGTKDAYDVSKYLRMFRGV